jgi:serine/threonine protein kinase
MLLQSSGHLLLTDFGSAASLSHSSVARKHSRALVGTPDYIAPEVLRHAEKVFEESEEEDEFGGGEEEVDPEERAYGAEVDVWACGVVMYEASRVFLTFLPHLADRV